MKSVVIAAGYATRLGELTRNFPKPLLKIGERSILDRMLDDIDGIPQIDEHIIITNHKFAPIFEQWARERTSAPDGAAIHEGPGSNDGAAIHEGPGSDDGAAIHEGPGSDDGAAIHEGSGGDVGADGRTSAEGRKRITVVDDGTVDNEHRLGAVCDLLYAMDLLKIDEDMLVTAADNLLFFSFRDFVEFAERKGTSCIMYHEQPSVEKLQRTGVVELDEDGRVLGMEEKPMAPKTHFAVPPFYIYKRGDLDLVRESVRNGCGKDAPGNLAHYLVDRTVMHAWCMNGGRFDIGSLDTYHEACRKYGSPKPKEV